MPVHPGIPAPVPQIFGRVGVYREQIGPDPVAALGGRLVDAFERSVLQTMKQKKRRVSARTLH